MARRIELQGIANSFNTSFISRNNDFKGYWAIGQLKLFTLNNGIHTMEFSFPTKATHSTLELLNYTKCHYSRMLEQLLKKQKIPSSWVKEASITLDFHTAVEDSLLPECSAFGSPFSSLCQIIDDKGHIYSSLLYGRCLPHSPLREWRSTRNSF